jgi:hypothetical protein
VRENLSEHAPQRRNQKLMLPKLLVALSAAIIFTLGGIHLLYTFYGRKLLPRDPELRSSMNAVSPVISDQTTMWKAWIGFNASHSLGAILFGSMYGYLAAFEADILFGSIYLTLVGFVMLIGLFLLGKRYWFSAPFIGISISLVCYISGVALWWL